MSLFMRRPLLIAVLAFVALIVLLNTVIVVPETRQAMKTFVDRVN